MAAEDPRRDPLDHEDPRLTSLDARLEVAQRQEAKRTGQTRKDQGKGYSQGSRVLAELIAGPAGGALIGWLLDRWIDTAPLFLFVMMALGVVVAFRSIFRISNERPE